MSKPRQPASRKKPTDTEEISSQPSNRKENNLAVRKRAKAEMKRLRPVIVAYGILFFLICTYVPFQSKIIRMDGTAIAEDRVKYYPVSPGPNFGLQKSEDQSSGMRFWFIDSKRIALELGIASALAGVVLAIIRRKKTDG